MKTLADHDILDKKTCMPCVELCIYINYGYSEGKGDFWGTSNAHASPCKAVCKVI